MPWAYASLKTTSKDPSWESMSLGVARLKGEVDDVRALFVEGRNGFGKRIPEKKSLLNLGCKDAEGGT